MMFCFLGCHLLVKRVAILCFLWGHLLVTKHHRELTWVGLKIERSKKRCCFSLLFWVVNKLSRSGAEGLLGELTCFYKSESLLFGSPEIFSCSTNKSYFCCRGVNNKSGQVSISGPGLFLKVIWFCLTIGALKMVSLAFVLKPHPKGVFPNKTHPYEWF